jgi:4-amino-4-deoxy-L-arabinose transferase-like glycosyltransferase
MEKNISKYYIPILVGLTILGGILRFAGLSSIPPGLTVDEVSTGYNSYSILKTGRDEYGTLMPMTAFRSLNDYKPPFYIYASTIPISIFSLNEFSVRFLSAFIGTLTIPLSYFLFKTISPWHIYYSRLAFESPVAMSFVMAAVWLFLLGLEGKGKCLIASAILFVLSLYTYHSERVFVPLLLIFLVIYFWDLVKKNHVLIRNSVIVMVIMLMPLGLSLILGKAAMRASMTLITNDPNFLRNSLSSTIKDQSVTPRLLSETLGNKYLLLIFFILNKFISYLQPSFLFFQGLNLTQIGSYGLGVMYFFEIPTFFIGIWHLTKNRIHNSGLILGWLILGLLPALITLDNFNPIRLLLVLPMLILISAIGIDFLINWILNLSPHWKIPVATVITVLVVWNLLYAVVVYSVLFPAEKSEDFMYGAKEAAIFAWAQKDNYKLIVFDPMRGTIQPDIRNVPQLYLLFFSKYDPATYQALPKMNFDDNYSFDKFTVRPINWVEDKNKKGVLFIGSPWDFTNYSFAPGQIKQEFYLVDGQLALMAVSP